jgi:two-component system response regulator (stage 0 sporulation protein F)
MKDNATDKAGSDKTILVVDDEAGIRDAIEESLQLYGFKTYSASGGHAAFKIVRSQKIDLVISDLKMPEGNGIELLREIKSFSKDIPVVFISGFSDYTVDALLLLGAIRVFQKPFRMKDLTDYVIEQT